MNIAPRLALALAGGIVLALAIASSILRVMPALQFAFCTGPDKGGMCTVSALLFGYVYYSAITLPLSAMLFAAWGAWLLGRPGPQGSPRPAALTLGIALLLLGAGFHLLGFAVELGARLRGSSAGVANLAVTPLLAVGGFVAAWLLWKLDEKGRRLALLVLLVAIFSSLWSAVRYPQGILQSPVTLLVLALRGALFVYLLLPKVKALFRPPATTSL